MKYYQLNQLTKYYILWLILISANSFSQSISLSDSIYKKIHSKGINYFYNNQKELASIQFEKEINILDTLNVQNKDYYNAKLWLGKTYNRLGKYKKAENTLVKIPKKEEELYALSLKELAFSFHHRQDYIKAELYYKKAINLLEKLHNYKKLIKTYSHLITTYSHLKGEIYLKKRFEYLNKYQELLKKHPQKKIDYYKLNNQFAIYYREDLSFNFQKAKKYYLKNIRLYSYNKILQQISYNNLANLYVKTHNDSAQYYLNKTLKHTTTDRGKYYAYLNFSDYYLQKNKILKALETINKSINYAQNSLNNLSQSHLLIAQNRKVNLLQKIYQKNNTITTLEQMRKLISQNDSLIDIIKNNSHEREFKLFWSNEASLVYNKGVYCAKQLDNLELAFYFLEKNKALLLLNNSYRNRIKKTIPDSIIYQKNILSKTIYQLENKLKKNKNDSLNEQLFKKKQLLSILKQNILKKYPKYAKAIKKHKIITLDSVQKQLHKDEIILSYLWTNATSESIASNKANGLMITKNTSQFITINIDTLKQYINKYTTFLQKPIQNKQELKNYQKTAFELYKLLFPTKEMRTLIKNKKILILPDNKLQNIPFEALISKKNSSHYLIYDCEISYAYSMSFLYENKQLERKPKNTLLSIAPVNFSYDSLEHLPQTKNEVLSINTLFNGDKYLFEKVQKDTILKQLNNYSILHLATHAEANTSSTPWIAFSDKKMQLYELYTTTTQADLVTLSSCNTSLGEIANGEGVFSLARGFFYSGANTVVSSLWQVDDKATSEIMLNFYTQLKAGKTKSKALHLAKLDYINSHSLSEASPYYWASFILLGDAGQLQVASSTFNWWWLLLGVFVVALLLFLRSKRSSLR